MIRTNLVLPGIFSNESVYWSPEYLENSAWLEHIPFAFWIVDILRPSSIVELGTYRGASYFAFCQAVAKLELSTACYAVDTWKGDEHAGFFGESVYAQVEHQNDRMYSSFSRLVRSSFDDACNQFSDGSIDLLHIDGLHTYDAVRHDFEMWQPKLSDQAVVLFHDVNVRERDFGAYKFFEEIIEMHPHFSFLHCNGLGVLGVGANQNPAIQALFDASSDKTLTRAVREKFGGVGKCYSREIELRNSRQQRRQFQNEAKELRTELGKYKSSGSLNELLSLKVDVDKFRTKANELTVKLDALQQSNHRLKGRYEEQKASCQEQSSQHFMERSSIKSELTARSEEVKSLKLEIAIRFKEIEALTGLYLDLSDALRANKVSSLAKQTYLRASFESWYGTPVRILDILFRKNLRALMHQEKLLENSPFFDSEWYLKKYPDVKKSPSFSKNPVRHYLLYGHLEFRAPGPDFDTSYYVAQYPDVAEAGINPLLHYVLHGEQEGREVGVS